MNWGNAKNATNKGIKSINTKVTGMATRNRKGKINKKLMKNERNRQRRKVRRLQANTELSFMALNNEEDERNDETERSLFSNELSIKDLENNDEYWIGDTGATTHITNHSAGIYNCAYPTGATKVLMEMEQVNKEKNREFERKGTEYKL